MGGAKGTGGTGVGRSRRRTQAERRSTSTEKMLDGALALIGERRSLSFSLAEVAERAGFSRGQPTHAFGTRDNMIRQLVPHLHVRSDTIFGSRESRGEGLQAILRTAELLLDAGNEQAALTVAVHVLLAEASIASSPYRDAVAQLNFAAIDYIEAHLHIAGERREIAFAGDRRCKAILIMAAIRGSLLQWLVTPDDIALDTLRRELVQSLRRDLGAV